MSRPSLSEDHSFDFDEPSLPVAHRDEAVLDTATGAVAGAQAELDRCARDAPVQYACDDCFDPRAIARIDKFSDPGWRGQQGVTVMTEPGDAL